MRDKRKKPETILLENEDVLKLLEEKTTTEIGKMFRVSIHTVNKCINKAIKKRANIESVDSLEENISRNILVGKTDSYWSNEEEVVYKVPTYNDLSFEEKKIFKNL